MPLTINKNVTVTVEGDVTGRELSSPKVILFEDREDEHHTPSESNLFAEAALWLKENQDYTAIIATDFSYAFDDGFYMALALVVE